MVKVHVAGVPIDEEVVFIISLLIFLMLTAQYFIQITQNDFYLQYTSGIGAFLSALSIYVFYKLHLIEEKLSYAVPVRTVSAAPSAPAKKRR
ncbi:MAG: hypothetical protein V1835_02865 [Candidatus Micrarchaeota archaeon]